MKRIVKVHDLRHMGGSQWSRIPAELLNGIRETTKEDPTLSNKEVAAMYNTNDTTVGAHRYSPRVKPIVLCRTCREEFPRMHNAQIYCSHICNPRYNVKYKLNTKSWHKRLLERRPETIEKYNQKLKEIWK